RAAGSGPFSVPAGRLDSFLAAAPAETARRMETDFLAVPAGPAFQQRLAEYLAAAAPAGTDRFRRIRRAAITLLETPAYQLC
ncbi:MAG TPA: hypothetical protein VHV47_13340, partial [Opitutaceae bacterium]|nr:hypothetical protein [Opitutaceae bacterium]